MAANRGCDVPSAGISYPITLGDTLLSDKASHSYCSLRYDFKPASAGRFRQGSVVVNLPDAAAQGTDMSFSGRHEHSRDGLDCVAIFDGVTDESACSRRAARVPTPPPQALQPEVIADADVAGDDMVDALVAALENRASEKEWFGSDVGEAMEEEGPDQDAAHEEEAEPDRATSQTASPSPRAQGSGALAGVDMSELEREFMRAPDDSSDESDDDEALNHCSDDDSELALEDF
ncbi:hypothetical protein COCSUDRAFT_63347 [Coccomyxa subellipsoidea C-169]|uniref:Transcription elongation factor Eaf N-terminal domain-containing protein n=1 Tax=Coccomyxa subellipsoidea (strain C-169) TaxID=574566 RepID=I0YX31_COCSC|nr:hypothetical protein COCSUDRAFT_63347 [Coccomyxa subellipsoidea C-169]EIE22950.1 hypothetical protein COCSUDRAFT_63347 [Coccomyxa subellipsoidea C-169]|eukprot:XP_005647494.1 hypothetical protein COCSUDRAFT_63347 [Coccomyxa subellipsoidea C-169]